MTICEYCGASVHGNVCEYCDMPVKNVKPAPPEMIYKSIKSPKHEKILKTENHLNPTKSKRKPKLKLNKRGKKFLRIMLALTVSGFAISAITLKLAINHNPSRPYVQSATEYVIEHSNYYNYGYEYNYYDDDGYLLEEAVPVYDANEILQENGVFPSGTYQIGVDIPEGQYIFIPDMADGHGVEGVYADPECVNQISTAYVHFDGTRIAEISGNGYLKFSWCTAYNLDMYPEIANDPHKTDGMFIVGRDIPAGTYTIIGYGEYEDMAEWYIYSSINAVGAVIRESGTLESYDKYYDKYYGTITLHDGEYFELRDCIIGDFD